MRLLDLQKCDLEAGKLTLIDTGGSAPPRYAILSHTWESEEILFADVERGDPRSKAGYAKVKGVIQQALQDRAAYLWIDTCCIDKSSSAELSEAINSMYRWYEDATRCYGYLNDVGVDARGPSPSLNANVDNKDGRPRALLEQEHLEAQFRASKWFTRGWTLQELIAPASFLFYDRNWNRIGNKIDLQELVSSITGIPSGVLRGRQVVDSMSVARRMSWAAYRKTTRIEDIAYCLIGLFSVNMPLLYGEGERAFIRLQEEILKASDDYTIFAWKTPPVKVHGVVPKLLGLLANHPSAFKDTGDVLPYQWDSEPFLMTNKGLRLSLGVWNSMAILPCTPSAESHELLGVDIEEVPGGFNQFARIDSATLHLCTARGQLQSMYFPQTPSRLKKIPMPLRTLRLCMGHQDAALPNAIPVEAWSMRERDETLVGAGRKKAYKVKNENAITTLPDRLAGGGVSEALHMYTWNTGLWFAILFRRLFEGPGKSKSRAYFMLLLGTMENGEIGFCLHPVDAREEGMDVDVTKDSLSGAQSPRSTSSLGAIAMQELLSWTNPFHPVEAGEKSAVKVKVTSTAPGHLRRRSETVSHSEIVSVELRERPSRPLEGNQLSLTEVGNVLEILVFTAPL